MIRRPPRSTRTDTLFPYTTLFRSVYGPGLEEAYDTIPAEVYIKARDRDGNDMKRGGDPFLVAVTGTSGPVRSEEHTSELQSLMRISYAVFCLKKKNSINRNHK